MMAASISTASIHQAGTIWKLLAILLLALALRLWGAYFDLPYIFHPDEPINVEVMQTMVAQHSLNPHYFAYPSLLYDLGALLLWGYSALHHLLAPATWQDGKLIGLGLGIVFASDSDAVAMLRTLTLLGGVISTWLTYLIGRRGEDATAGLIAAALFAISPLLIDDCQHVIPDSYVVPFALATLLASQRIARTGDWPAYLLAGAATGLTAAAKYPGVLICLSVATAHVLHAGFDLKKALRLLAAAIVSAAVFLLVSPYILLDHSAFAKDYLFQLHHYRSGHDGMEGNVLSFYAGRLLLGTGIACFLALAQAVSGWRQRHATTIILTVFTIGYLCFILQFPVRNDRTLSPALPGILLLAAIFVRGVVARLRHAQISAGLRGALLATMTLGLIATPLMQTIRQGIRATTVDSRTTARKWIDANLPAQSIVAIESYAPFIDPNRFKVVQNYRAIDQPPSWYADNRVDYLVLSQGMFGRYLEHPDRYPAEAARYAFLANSMHLIKRFTDGGYEIAVYETKQTAE